MTTESGRRPSPHPYGFILEDEIFILESPYGWGASEAESFADWLLEAAAWIREQEVRDGR